MKTNKYTLKYIDQEFYLLCGSKPRVGCGVVETLNDGTSMLMTIHNPFDIALDSLDSIERSELIRNWVKNILK